MAAFVVRQVLNWFGAFASPCVCCGFLAWLRLVSGDTLNGGVHNGWGKGNLVRAREEEGIGFPFLAPPFLSPFGARKAVVVYEQDRGFNSLASNMINYQLMKQNAVVCWSGSALLFFIFRFRARKVTGTFEKRAPESLNVSRIPYGPGLSLNV